MRDLNLKVSQLIQTGQLHEIQDVLTAANLQVDTLIRILQSHTTIPDSSSESQQQTELEDKVTPPKLVSQAARLLKQLTESSSEAQLHVAASALQICEIIVRAERNFSKEAEGYLSQTLR